MLVSVFLRFLLLVRVSGGFAITALTMYIMFILVEHFELAFLLFHDHQVRAARSVLPAEPKRFTSSDVHQVEYIGGEL